MVLDCIRSLVARTRSAVYCRAHREDLPGGKRAAKIRCGASNNIARGSLATHRAHGALGLWPSGAQRNEAASDARVARDI
jgi:hypothetical protein